MMGSRLSAAPWNWEPFPESLHRATVSLISVAPIRVHAGSGHVPRRDGRDVRA
ncbi:MAG: hypothetical protein MZV64_33480 [Ignavibacteriales bacterium]|nr:hypothetical protein [Ignavibacteriales bacterium]